MNPVGLLATPWITSNYTEVLASESFWQQLGSSILIAVLTTLTVVAFASLAAFVFARRRSAAGRVLFTFFTLGLLFPTAVAILPLFILVGRSD